MAGLEELLNILKENRAQPSVEAEAIENNECPFDAWPLKENSKGQKSCPICGRIF